MCFMMSLSSVLITAQKNRLRALISLLQTMPAVEVHQKDPATDRCVAIIEAENADQQAEIFQAIQALDDTLDISLVAFHFDEERNE